MDFEFLKPVRKTGFTKLEVAVDAGKVTRLKLITKPRKLDELIQGEMELRTEIHLTLGSELMTFGLDKFLLIMKELMGRGDRPINSTLKYEVVRLKPEYMPEERSMVEKLYFKKVNAPVRKFIDALGPRVKKVREFMRDADHVMREEVREVAAKEVMERLKKTSADFGFDLDKISKVTGGILGRVADMLGEKETPKVEAQEYQAVIRKKTSHQDVETKPQLIIIQQGSNLQIIGGSEMDVQFDDINPELLYDTLRLYLLTKVQKEKKSSRNEEKITITDESA
jgi:hypothetical protein